MKIIVETSARHLHVTQSVLETLFGAGHKLTPRKDLSQPGQFACEEKVELVGPKSSIKLSILGPVRPETQIELSKTDARVLGVDAPIKMSGNIKGTPGIKLVGPAGTVEISEGVIVAKRHAHMTPEQAQSFGITDGQNIGIRVGGDGRMTVFQDVIARVSTTAGLAVHIDTDEANAAGLNGTVEGEIVIL